MTALEFSIGQSFLRRPIPALHVRSELLLVLFARLGSNCEGTLSMAAMLGQKVFASPPIPAILIMPTMPSFKVLNGHHAT